MAASTPERARTLGRLVGLPGGTVEAEPTHALELLIHYEDWARLLAERHAIFDTFAVDVDLRTGIKSVYGIPVSET